MMAPCGFVLSSDTSATSKACMIETKALAEPLTNSLVSSGERDESPPAFPALSGLNEVLNRVIIADVHRITAFATSFTSPVESASSLWRSKRLRITCAPGSYQSCFVGIKDLLIHTLKRLEVAIEVVTSQAV